MKLTKTKLKQVIKEEFDRLKEEDLPPASESYDGAEPVWELVKELDEMIPRLQKIREALHGYSGVFEGINNETN